MGPIKNINSIFIAPFFMVVFLTLSVPAHADWGNTGMRPVLAPNLNPIQRQPAQHATHVNVAPSARVEPQHRIQPALPVGQKQYIPKPQGVRTAPPLDHNQALLRHEREVSNDLHRNFDFYGQYDNIPTIVMPSTIVVPDGFEAIVVQDQVYYYYQGVFYQLQEGQLMAVPPVLGAVVDSIPQDYQIVMADGVNYCVWSGIYFQRVPEGFEVVVPPTPTELSLDSDQEPGLE